MTPLIPLSFAPSTHLHHFPLNLLSVNMPSRDDDSSSSESTVSSIEEYTPPARKAPARTQSMVTKPTFAAKTTSSARSTSATVVSDSDDDSDDSSDDEAAKQKKKTIVRRAPARALSMPVTKAKGSSSDNAAGVYINETTLLMSKQAADMAASLKMSMDAASVHSRDNEVEAVIDFTADLCDFKALDIGTAVKPKKDKKGKKGDKAISVRELGKMSIEAKKEERMERVRQRIEAEEDRKQKELYHAKMKEIEDKKADMSEAGRRKRCWEWYSRTGMISKAAFIEKIPYLPPAASLDEADVELLPWNARGTMVNVAKLNGMLLSSS
ncbi:hypothetical protein MPSEU_000041500 [Mayamaea pseudoterrestris]|nr:hypothetical protein MPSEU_000041500 [Mayamaea pseudoterrestris]